jgi:hypothetical protein
MVKIDTIGLAPQDEGKADESQMSRFLTKCDSPRELIPARRGSSPIFTVAWQWAEVIVV